MIMSFLFSIFQITLGIRGATGKAQYRAQKEKNNPIKILDLSLLGAEDLILGSKQICSGAFPLLPQYIKVCIYYLWIASSGGFCIFCRLLELKDHLDSPSRCHPGLIVKPSWRWSLINQSRLWRVILLRIEIGMLFRPLLYLPTPGNLYLIS